MAEHVRQGAEQAAATPPSSTWGAWVVTVVSDDSAAAKHAARILVAFYISSMPSEQLARHGIDAEELAPVVEALGAGEIAKAVELFRPEYAEELCLQARRRGVAKIQADIRPASSTNDLRASDAEPCEVVPNVPDINGQVRLVADRVMPAFEPAVASGARGRGPRREPAPRSRPAYIRR